MIYKYSNDEQTAFVDTDKRRVHVITFFSEFKQKCRCSFTFEETQRTMDWELKYFQGAPVALPAFSYMKWQKGEPGEVINREVMEAFLFNFPDFS